MERLTIKTEKGAALKMASTYPSEDAARNDLMQRYRIAVDHLADYEDTGLTPVEISELKGLWKVVCELYGINTVGLSTNNPLTLEELRGMDGEPVWVKVVDHTVFSNKEDDFDGYGMCRSSWVRVWDGKRADLVKVDYDFVDYGKKWLAYRRRPEEGTD